MFFFRYIIVNTLHKGDNKDDNDDDDDDDDDNNNNNNIWINLLKNKDIWNLSYELTSAMKHNPSGNE